MILLQEGNLNINLCITILLIATAFKELVILHGLPDCFIDYSLPCVSFKDHFLNAVHNNYEIIDSNYNWSQSAFLGVKRGVKEGLFKPPEN